MMTPTTASAQSAGCTAVNNGGLNFRAVFVNSDLNTAQSTARSENTVTNRAIHAIRTVAGTTDPDAGTAAYLDGGTLYPFAAGDQINLTMTVSNFSTSSAIGAIGGAFRNGSNATATAQVGTVRFTANDTATRQYSVTGAETSIGLLGFADGSPTNGTIDFAVTCTPATPPAPTINSIAPTGGSSGGGTPVTITGTNFVNTSAYSATFGGTTVPATFASATTLRATTPAGNGAVTVSVTDNTRNLAASGAATFTYAAPTVTALSATSGPANQTRAVTITGTNFTPSATVTVDGVAATGVSFVSATQLNATLPARTAGTYGVRVTTGSVTTAANPPADQYTYIAAPTLTSVTPNSGTTLGGTSVTITGTNFTNATAVTFGGAGAQSFVVNSATEITAVTPARPAGPADVSVTTGGGTATLVGGFSYVVLTAPAVMTQPADQTVAVGATATFNAAASGSPAPSVQWQVSTNGGASFTNIPGATSTSYTTPPTVASDNGNRYRAVFTNTEDTVTTNAATLTVVQAPTANAQSVAVPFNTATAITLTGTDPNTPARTLTYNVATGPARGTLSGTAPNLTYAPTTNARGADSFTFTVSNGVATSAPATVSITIADPTLTTNTPPAGQRGAAYDFTFTTSGGSGSYSYAITSGALPAGLTLSTGGRITGTPAASGSFPFTVTVTDTGLGSPPVTQSQAFTLSIATPTLTASPPSPLPGGTVGLAYSVNLSTSGGTAPYSYAVTGGSLPAGLTLAADGRLSGTPTQAGGYTFSVTATDSSPPESGGPYTLTVAYSGNIRPPTIDVTPASIPQPQVGAAYTANLGATGGTAPYTFSVSTGALPTGLALAPNGTLSGTPTQGGDYDFTIAATDSSTGTNAPFSGTQQYTGTVLAPAIAIAPSALLPATGGQPYSQTLTASGGTAPYSYAVTAGALPTGVTLSPTGVLSGTPTVQGSFPFTVTATDSSTGGPNPGGRYAGSVAYTLSVGAPSIVIAPESLPAGTVAAAYSQILTASGGTGSYAFTLATGTLPAGLALATDGTLSGTPTAGGTFSFTVRATDGNGFTGTRAYTLDISAPTIAVAPGAVPDATRNVAYSQTFTASGGTAPYGFAVTGGALPTGLSLAANGVLSGTPTAGGTFNFTVTATDSSTGTGAFAGSLAYSLTVVVPDIQIAPAALAQGITRVPYAQTLTASGGTGPYGFAVTAGALPAGITLSTEGTLAGTTTQSGSFSFTATATDANGNAGSRPYSLVIEAPAIAIAPATLPAGTAGLPYAQALTASGGAAPYGFAVTAGALPAGITLASDGTLSGTTTQTGSFGFTATATDSNGNTGEQAYSLVFGAPAIAIAPTTLPDGTGSVAYAQTLTASGGVGPYVFSAAGTLPPGLTLATDGTLSGTPTQGGSFAFTVTATDANGFAGSADYTVRIDPPAIALAPATLPDGTGSVAYAQTLTASGGVGPYVFSATGTLPPGLTLATDGTLSGTPTQGGSFAFTVTATDTNGFAGSADYTVRIDPPAIAIAPATLPDGTGSVAYLQTLTASGGVGPYVFSAAGTLPPGLALAADGTLSGTPTQGGSFAFTVTATDANGFAGSADYTVRIDPPAIALAPATLPDGTGSVAYLQTLTASGGVGPYAFTATGTLPPGLALAPDGTLSGTPTQGGSFAFTVTATDTNGFAGSADYTVRIGAPAIALAPGALPAATVGTPYGQAITASGGAAPYGFALAGGTLPPGLALGADGVLSGTPTAGGSFEIVVRASDANGFTGTATYTLRVEGELPTAADATVTVLAGTALTVDLTAGATGGPFTGAALVSQPDPRIGTAALDRGGAGTSLVFAADPAGAGRTSITFTLSNAFGPSNVATLTVLVEARPDPALDPEVVGLLGAQADSTRRIASAQIRNFRDRLERTHDEDERRRGSANISIGLPSESSANDPIALFEERGQTALDDRFATLDPASGGKAPTFAREPAAGSGVEGPRSNAAFWAGGFVNFGSRDVDEVSIDLDRTLVGLSAGVDYRFTPQFVGGVGIGYGRERADIGENGTTSRAEAYSGVLYGSFAPGANLFLDGLVGYSRLEFDSHRHVTATGEIARGERSGDQVFGSLTATWEHRGQAHLFAPYLGLEGSHARLDAFTEAGASPFTLTYGRQDVSSLAGIVGLRLESEVAFDWGVLTPRARIEYAHDFARSDRASIGYADVGTLAYGVRTDVEGQDRLEFGIGFDAAFVDGWTLALDYRPALGLGGGQRDHSGTLTLTKPF